MKAMVLGDRGSVETNRLTLTAMREPELSPTQVRIEVDACAMCRTDLQIASGDLPVHRNPVIPGHQIIGRIVDVGGSVAPERVGQRVGVAWIARACGECRFCRAGRENLCEFAAFTGWDVDGGYATHTVAESGFAFDLAMFGDRSSASIAPLMCAGVIGYRALRIAEIDSESTGMRLGLYGYGASARQVLQIARHWNVAVHVAARTSQDCDAALADGASSAGYYADLPTEPLAAAITFAPVGSVVLNALDALDRGGIVAINAIHLDEIPAFNYDDLWWERSIRSIANVTPADVAEFLELAAKIDLRAPYECLDLEAANDGMRRMQSGDVVGSFVLERRRGA